jgi:hypothetical protein
MLKSLLTLTALLCFGSVASAQVGITLTLPQMDGEPGQSVTMPISLTLDTAAQGFQLGVAHEGTFLTATAIDQGPALLATNAGGGADYFFQDLSPTGGTGVNLGAILSLTPPLESLPAGTHHIASITYTVNPAALPGTSAPVTVVSSLGSPPLAAVISVSSTSIAPTVENGLLTVVTPPVTGLTSTILDPCTCAAQLSWANNYAYDSIQILQNGSLLVTLPGTSTSHLLTLGAQAEYCVRGISNAAAATDACILAGCSVLPVGTPPSGLACTIDHVTCAVSASWTNNQGDYTSIDLLLDGALLQTLPGTATAASLTLPTTEVLSTIAIVAHDACGITLAPASCAIECLPEQFVRGNTNGDAGIDISDAIATLDYTFSGGAGPCLDALDCNDDGGIDVSDAIFILAYTFSGGAAPPAPFGAPGSTCGIDPTDDALDCLNYTCP